MIKTRLENDLLNYESKYEQNGVLINKLNLTNEEDLNEAERMLTSYKLAKLYLDPGVQNFDVQHYLSIHKFLFDDIYYFAGEIRKENISKHLPFCLPQFIYQELQNTLKSANKKIKDIVDRDKLLVFITKLYSDLDIIHPFREGNGRCEREFLRQFIEHICKVNNLDSYYLDYSQIKDRDEYIRAVVKADALLEYDELLKIFDSILKVEENLLEDNKIK